MTCKTEYLIPGGLFTVSFLYFREAKKQQVLEEADTRLKQVVAKNFRAIALALKGFDAYQYQRAYTGGLQEFIEALVFYQFLAFDKIDKWETISKLFQYEEEGTRFCLLFPQTDFLLGIADFTGELMRRCINNLGIGNINECFKICNLVKHIQTGFLGFYLIKKNYTFHNLF